MARSYRHIQQYYERYIEVFGGAGWVLFHKPPGNDFECYNDFNSNLVNLYRCVRDNSNKLKYKLRYVLDSRQDFEWIWMRIRMKNLKKLMTSSCRFSKG